MELYFGDSKHFIGWFSGFRDMLLSRKTIPKLLKDRTDEEDWELFGSYFDDLPPAVKNRWSEYHDSSRSEGAEPKSGPGSFDLRGHYYHAIDGARRLVWNIEWCSYFCVHVPRSIHDAALRREVAQTGLAMTLM
jgi:hypothetical protein